MSALPQAELLYENGTPVEQLATCEPLLVGKTEVVAMQAALARSSRAPHTARTAHASRAHSPRVAAQGSALFKLRITSLSSHRDKQRFRIRVSPADAALLLHEPGLSVVTTPMKCVTKLSHRSSTSDKQVMGDGEEEEWDESATGKRKRDELESLLEGQGQQLQQLQESQTQILAQLQTLKQLLSSRFSSP